MEADCKRDALAEQEREVSDGREGDQKRPYEPGELVRYGTVEELTAGEFGGSATDAQSL